MKALSLLMGAVLVAASAAAMADNTVYTVNVDNHYAPDQVHVFSLRTSAFGKDVRGNIKVDAAGTDGTMFTSQPEVVTTGKGTLTLDSTQGATIYFDVNRSSVGGACRIEANVAGGTFSSVKTFDGIFVGACKNFKVTTAGTTLNINYVKI